MPCFEFALIFRVLPKPELKAALQRAAGSLLTQGGILHKIENLGTRQLPYKMRKYQVGYTTGSYYLLHFDSTTKLVDVLLEEYNRDVDILKFNVFNADDKVKPVNCTLEYELLPPAYRPEVHKLMHEGRRKEKKKFDMHVDYYPF